MSVLWCCVVALCVVRVCVSLMVGGLIDGPSGWLAARVCVFVRAVVRVWLVGCVCCARCLRVRLIAWLIARLIDAWSVCRVVRGFIRVF